MVVEDTQQRITVAALGLFLSRGVKKTDLGEVAAQAGVSRVTVYRYCSDRKGLVQSVCDHIVSIFQDGATKGPTDSLEEIDARLNSLGEALEQLPKGNLLACLEEIHRLYPDVYEDFCAKREAAVNAMFQQALEVATRERALREGINPEVLKVIFWAAVVGLIENPALVSSNVSLAEICTTVTRVFRNGILIPKNL